MIQQEFEERVIVKVSAKEYEAIETVYMQSDLDKDEFCKLWIKMNKSRVNQAKKDKVEEEEKEKTRTMLFELSNMPQGKDFSLLADNYYNKKVKKLWKALESQCKIQAIEFLYSNLYQELYMKSNNISTSCKR